MQAHRLWITTTLCWFFLLFNIERLVPAVNLASFIYVLSTFAGVSVLCSRRLRHAPFGLVATAFAIVAVLTKCFLGYYVHVDSIGLTLLEIASVVFSLWLCRNIGRSADEFVNSSDQLLQVLKAMALPTLQDAEPAIAEEIRRARRHERPLTFVTLSLGKHPQVDLGALLSEALEKLQSECLIGTLGQMMAKETKSHDIIARDGDKFFMLLPETNLDEANAMTTRLTRQASERLGVQLKAERIAFGSDELTMTGVFNRVEQLC